MAGRLIFHCDGNNFFASCECIEHPEWRDVPMAVAGDPKDRCGIVVAKNGAGKESGCQDDGHHLASAAEMSKHPLRSAASRRVRARIPPHERYFPRIYGFRGACFD